MAKQNQCELTPLPSSSRQRGEAGVKSVIKESSSGYLTSFCSAACFSHRAHSSQSKHSALKIEGKFSLSALISYRKCAKKTSLSCFFEGNDSRVVFGLVFCWGRRSKNEEEFHLSCFHL